jgi:hypothetical protein
MTHLSSIVLFDEIRRGDKVLQDSLALRTIFARTFAVRNFLMRGAVDLVDLTPYL